MLDLAVLTQQNLSAGNGTCSSHGGENAKRRNLPSAAFRHRLHSFPYALLVGAVPWAAAIRLLALAAWLAAAMHCRVAELPGLQFLACAADSSPGHCDCPGDSDGCAAVESGSYRPEEVISWSPALSPTHLPDPGIPAGTPTPIPEAPSTIFVSGQSTPGEPGIPWRLRHRPAGAPRAP